ncbi:Pyridine nucleotide-disulfide oxidoreductase family protein [Desulfovibrio sp. X2]|uniref:NAD(P)/FAD-dependent oxidoreductase n=1 Tax=Desulfovibrio sp. X2 TaxID=941449 RepID=UPI000358CC47|nr:FAD-dependent oxidoreductase [Desulfovibrio sp. X2]EPR43592.1 Pyridine nucleotide-disulfide oxidoreductase family protein [Desulfovibrio sp. X2]
MGHLVLVGAGHAHLAAVRAIPRMAAAGHRVTCVAPGPHHYYSGMGPGLLGGFYEAAEVRFPVERMVRERGGVFVRGEAVRIEPEERRLILSDGSSIHYDVLSLNTGSRVAAGAIDGGRPQDARLQDVWPQDVWPVKPVGALLAARGRLAGLARERGRVAVCVAGGGPAGVEVAGNAARAVRLAGGRPVVTLLAGSSLLAGFPARLRALALGALAGQGVRVLEGIRLAGLSPGLARLSDGKSLLWDVAFLAPGIEPSPLARDSGLPVGPSCGLLVDGFLKSPAHPEIFGGGDCIDFAPRPLDKVGVYAVRQNPVLAENLAAALCGRPLRAFDPGAAHYLLLLNAGDGTALAHKRGLCLRGRWAMALKDFIDRRFMRRFGASA